MSIDKFLGFNPDEVKAADSMEAKQIPVPNGEYKAVCSKAERKNNKAGTGWYWELTFSIVGGEYEGRTIVHRFNIKNNNEVAEQIGRSQLKKFLECIGNEKPENEDDMTDIALFLEVKCENSSFMNNNGEKIDTVNNKITNMFPFKKDTPKSEPAPTLPEPEEVEETADKKSPPWKSKKGGK
jgi:hypothetical protein